MHTTCSIIIPAHNEACCILATLDSIYSQTRQPDQVIVVDDFSTDGTGQLVREHFPRAIVIRPLGNLGSKAKAQNYALFKDDLITGDCVITIDADTTLKSDALEKMLEKFDEDPSLMAACGTVIPANLDNVYTLGRLGEYLFAFALPKAIQQAYGGSIYIVSGCFGCYRTEQLRERGGWHTTTMAEDMDLTADYHKRNWKVAYIQEAVCYPIEPYNFKTYRDQLRRWSAAYFQNISLHWKDYFSRPFGFFLWLSFFDAGVGGIEFYFFYPLLAYLVGWQQALWLFLIYDVLGITIPILWFGTKMKMTGQALASIPFVFYLRVLNVYFWFEAMWREWILKKHLNVYIKGH